MASSDSASASLATRASGWARTRLRQHGRRGLGHSQLFERHTQRQRHLGHRGIQPVAFAGHAEGRRAEELAVVLEVLVVVRRLAPGQWP